MGPTFFIVSHKSHHRQNSALHTSDCETAVIDDGDGKINH